MAVMSLHLLLALKYVPVGITYSHYHPAYQVQTHCVPAGVAGGVYHLYPDRVCPHSVDTSLHRTHWTHSGSVTLPSEDCLQCEYPHCNCRGTQQQNISSFSHYKVVFFVSINGNKDIYYL